MSNEADKDQFERAFRNFINAHGRGMRSLRARDFQGFQKAIETESAAVEQATAAIDGALEVASNRQVVAPGVPDSDPAIEAEHARLLNRMEALEREHHDLETRPHDVAGHRDHRAKLHAHIAELRAHLQRLRAHGSSTDQ